MEGFTDSDKRDAHDTETANKAIRGQIAFGMDCEQFLASDIGRYLSARANHDRKALLEDLAVHDANDINGVQHLQMEIRVCSVWVDWLKSAIDEGLSAQATAIERGTL